MGDKASARELGLLHILFNQSQAVPCIGGQESEEMKASGDGLQTVSLWVPSI